MRTASFLALALALLFASADRTAAQPKGKAKTPQEIYAQFRATMSEGKFDIAGIYDGMREKSQEFLAAGAKVYLPELRLPADS